MRSAFWKSSGVQMREVVKVLKCGVAGKTFSCDCRGIRQMKIFINRKQSKSKQRRENHGNVGKIASDFWLVFQSESINAWINRRTRMDLQPGRTRMVGSVGNRKCDTDQRTSRLLTQFVGSKVSSVCIPPLTIRDSTQAPVTTLDWGRTNKKLNNVIESHRLDSLQQLVNSIKFFNLFMDIIATWKVRLVATAGG